MLTLLRPNHIHPQLRDGRELSFHCLPACLDSRWPKKLKLPRSCLLSLLEFTFIKELFYNINRSPPFVHPVIQEEKPNTYWISLECLLLQHLPPKASSYFFPWSSSSSLLEKMKARSARTIWKTGADILIRYCYYSKSIALPSEEEEDDDGVISYSNRPTTVPEPLQSPRSSEEMDSARHNHLQRHSAVALVDGHHMDLPDWGGSIHSWHMTRSDRVSSLHLITIYMYIYIVQRHLRWWWNCDRWRAGTGALMYGICRWNATLCRER